MIGEKFSEIFEKFLNFGKFFRSFRSFEFSKNRSRREDSFGSKIIEIGAYSLFFGRRTDALTRRRAGAFALLSLKFR